MHRRAAIRQAVIASLSGINATVRAGLIHPEPVGDLPAVFVMTAAETVMDDDEDMVSVVRGAPDFQLQRRMVEVEIEIRASAGLELTGIGAPVEDALDAVALEVEQALGGDVELGGAVDFIRYAGSDVGDLSGDLELPIGIRTLTYSAEYRVDAADPQALED